MTIVSVFVLVIPITMKVEEEELNPRLTLDKVMPSLELTLPLVCGCDYKGRTSLPTPHRAISPYLKGVDRLTILECVLQTLKL